MPNTLVPPDLVSAPEQAPALDTVRTLVYHNVYFISRHYANGVEVGEMKWDLDLWYELWDKAGSQGLDTWYDLRGEEHDLPDTGHTPDAGPDVIEDGREGI
jgi:hypothetical protein